MRKSLCDRIKELREDHDLTQFEVAEILGCAKYTYQRYEYGELLLPTDKLVILADLLPYLHRLYPRTHQRSASVSPGPVNACCLFTVCAGPLVLCQKSDSLPLSQGIAHT